jgi:hypothetical protein
MLMATPCWAQAAGRRARPRGDGRDGRSLPPPPHPSPPPPLPPAPPRSPPLPPASPRHLLTRYYLQIRFRIRSCPRVARALRASHRAAQGRCSRHVCDAAGGRRCRRCWRIRIAMDDDWRRRELERVGVHLLLYGFNLLIITRLRVGKLIALFPLPQLAVSKRFPEPNHSQPTQQHAAPPPHAVAACLLKLAVSFCCRNMLSRFPARTSRRCDMRIGTQTRTVGGLRVRALQFQTGFSV